MMTHRDLLITRVIRLFILVAAAALAVGVLAGISQTKAVGSYPPSPSKAVVRSP